MATAVKETWTVPTKDAELVAAVRTALAGVKPAVTYDKAAAEKHLAALKEVSFFDGVGNEFHFKGRLSKYATFFGKHIMAGLSMSDAIDAAIANEINSRSEKTTNDLIDTPIVPGDLATFPKAKEPRDTEETPARSNGSTPSAGEGDQVVETEETPAQVPEVAGEIDKSKLNADQLLEYLAKPFPKNKVSTKVLTDKKTGKKTTISYVDRVTVINRLNRVMGRTGWQTKMIRNPDGTCTCDLSLRLPREDGGYEWVTRSDVGAETDWSPEKGSASDALKRAADQWGIALYLREK